MEFSVKLLTILIVLTIILGWIYGFHRKPNFFSKLMKKMAFHLGRKVNFRQLPVQIAAHKGPQNIYDLDTEVVDPDIKAALELLVQHQAQQTTESHASLKEKLWETDEQGNTTLQRYLSSDEFDTDTFNELLAIDSEILSATNDEGDTLLHTAAKHHQLDAVDNLIDEQFFESLEQRENFIEQQNHEGETALHAALYANETLHSNNTLFDDAAVLAECINAFLELNLALPEGSLFIENSRGESAIQCFLEKYPEGIKQLANSLVEKGVLIQNAQRHYRIASVNVLKNAIRTHNRQEHISRSLNNLKILVNFFNNAQQQHSNRQQQTVSLSEKARQSSSREPQQQPISHPRNNPSTKPRL